MAAIARAVRVPVTGAHPPEVEGDLRAPDGATGLVVFAHGSGSSRHSGRNRRVAAALNGAGLATLLVDLLTEREDREEDRRFDVALLGGRVVAALERVAMEADLRGLPVGVFGASTGAAAALIAAAERPDAVRAVVSRGGRPDLAPEPVLAAVRAPTLLVVGGADEQVLELNRRARRALRCESALEIVPGATHLFEEPGALERVADLAAAWLGHHLG